MERELLALIVERLDVLTVMYAKVHGGKNVPDPIRIPRPSDPATQITDSIADADGTVVSFSKFASLLRGG